MGAYANLSFAENLGVGSLGDGFIGLGQPDFLGNYYYELEVVTPDAAAPEPSSLALLALTGIVFLGSRVLNRN